jgi:phosphate transport system substrate-binding protein
MKQMNIALSTILFLLLLGTIIIAGCTGNSGDRVSSITDDKTSLSPSAMKQAASGSVLSIAGSTTVLPISALAAEEYMDSHPDLDVQVNGGGTGAGVQSAGVGTAMIGMASRDLKTEEKQKYPDLVEHRIAIDCIAIITNPANPVPSLTLDQIKKIYDGNITNWKDVGGTDAAIVVVGRDSASGTREFFYTDVMKKADFVKTQLEKNSNGAVQQTVAQTPSAIGYVGLGYVDETIHAVSLSVDGTVVSPGIETVKAGTYPISRPLLFLTKGEPSGDIADFIAFIDGPEGKKIIVEEGFIPVN